MIREEYLPKKQALDTPLSQYSDKIREAFPDGNMEVRPSEFLVPLITEKIYSDAKSGWRELLSNAYQYANDAKKLGASPEIRIICNPDTNVIELHEIDSMGISMENLRRILSNMGRSSNTDPTRHGKYGMGLAAASCLATSPLFEISSRDGDTYTMAKQHPTYYSLVSPPPVFKKPGMRIQLVLKEDIEMADIIRYTVRENLTTFHGIPTYLEITGDIEFADGPDYKKGVTKLHTCPLNEYVFGSPDSKKVSINLDDEGLDQKDCLKVELHGEGYSLYGGFFNRTKTHREYDIDLRVQNMPIGGHIDLDLSFGTINITNTDIYEPTPDRERLSKKSLEQLKSDIIVDLRKRLSKYMIGTMKEYLKSDYQWLYQYNSKYFMDLKVSSILGEQVMINDRIYGTSKEPIYKAFEGGDTVISIPRFNAGRIEALKERFHMPVIIKPTRGNTYMDEDESVSGIIDGLEYLKKNKIKTRIGSVVAYGKHEMCHVSLDKIDENIIRVPATSGIAEWRELFNGHFGNRLIIKDSARMAETSAITLRKFQGQIARKVIETSSGPIKCGKLLAMKPGSFVLFKKSEMNFTLKEFSEAMNGLLVAEYDDPALESDINMAYLARHKVEIQATSDNDQRVKMMAAAKLGIRFGGRWCIDHENAIKHLGRLRNVQVREMAARIFETSGDWDKFSGVIDELVRIDGHCDGLDKVGVMRQWIRMTPEIPREKRDYEGVNNIRNRITESIINQCTKMMIGKDYNNYDNLATILGILLEPVFGEAEYIIGDDGRSFTVKYDGRLLDISKHHILWRVMNYVSYAYSGTFDSIQSIVQKKDHSEVTFE